MLRDGSYKAEICTKLGITLCAMADIPVIPVMMAVAMMVVMVGIDDNVRE